MLQNNRPGACVPPIVLAAIGTPSIEFSIEAQSWSEQ